MGRQRNTYRNRPSSERSEDGHPRCCRIDRLCPSIYIDWLLWACRLRPNATSSLHPSCDIILLFMTQCHGKASWVSLRGLQIAKESLVFGMHNAAFHRRSNVSSLQRRQPFISTLVESAEEKNCLSFPNTLYHQTMLKSQGLKGKTYFDFSRPYRYWVGEGGDSKL